MPHTRALPLTLLLVLTLAGCGSPPLPRALGGPANELPFASEGEALAAAIEVYEGFQELYSELASSPGDDPTRLADWATGTYLEQTLEGLERWQANQWTRTGVSRSTDYVLQSYMPSEREGVVVIQLCFDITDVDVIDKDGASVVPEDRLNVGTMSATFDNIDGQLLLAGRILMSEEC